MRSNKDFMNPRKKQPLRCRYCKSTSVRWKQSDIWADTEHGWQMHNTVGDDLHQCWTKEDTL